MAITDRLASAQTSSDLQHHERDCDVDVIGAAGMAAQGKNMALFRLKYLGDARELSEVKAYFQKLARKVAERRNIQNHGDLALSALAYWLADVCNRCNGLKYQAIEGAPALSDKHCPACNGTGRATIKGHPQTREAIKDLHDYADAAVRGIRSAIENKYGNKNNY